VIPRSPNRAADAMIRTFRRAAGMSPRAFRRASKGDRKKVQERLAALA